MIVLIVLLVCWRLSAAGTYYLQRYAPTNIAVRYLRTRPGLKCAFPTGVALTTVYVLAAYAGTAAIDSGGPGWLHALVLLSIWNGMKFAVVSTLGPILLAKAVLVQRAERTALPRNHGLT